MNTATTNEAIPLPFNQNRLLDHVKEKLRLKNDAALARTLDVAPPVISKIRHNRLSVGAAVKIRILETTDMNIREVNYLIGTAAA